MTKDLRTKRLACVFLAVLLLALCGTPALAAEGGGAAETGAQAPLTAQRLPAPTGIQSKVTDTNTIYVYWNAVEGAAGYAVYRRVGSSGEYVKMFTTERTSYWNTTAYPGNVYYYKVMALGETEAENSALCSGYAYRTRKLPVPTGIRSQVADETSIRVSWDAVPRAAGYEVYRAIGSEYNDYVKIASTKGTAYTDTGAYIGRAYFYKVRAVSGVPGCSSDVSGSYAYQRRRPSSPKNVRSRVVAPTHIEITWDEVPGAVKYSVMRGIDDDGTGNGMDAYRGVGTVKGTSFKDTTAYPGAVYYYWIYPAGEELSGKGSWPAYRTMRLDAPTGVKSQVTGKNSIRVTWDEAPYATGYEVYRATSKNGTYQKMFTTANTSYTNTTAYPGKVYYYKVKATGRSPQAASSLSGYAYRTMRLDAPTGIKSQVTGKNSIRVTWNKTPYASKYEVYRATSKNGTYQKMFTTTNTSYTNTTAYPGRTYYYKVKAVGERSEAASNLSGGYAYRTMR